VIPASLFSFCVRVMPCEKARLGPRVKALE
jgi:hypothetical protein